MPLVRVQVLIDQVPPSLISHALVDLLALCHLVNRSARLLKLSGEIVVFALSNEELLMNGALQGIIGFLQAPTLEAGVLCCPHVR